jgi:5S rRNA maturation endonuclease (ribonuclease M5)
MGESNGEWGQQDSDPARDRRDRWLALSPLDKAASPVLDAFLKARALDYADLTRVGARWDAHEAALCFFYADGLKWRQPGTDKRWNEDTGIEWHNIKVVKRVKAEEGPHGIIVAEGETDAAALARHAPAYDVGVLPAGARGIPDGAYDVLRRYERVLVALDADTAGDEGASKILEHVPQAQRLRPPEDQDWCEVLAQGGWPNGVADPAELAQVRKRVWYTLGEVIDADLGTYDDNHWFEHGILPRQGLMIFHAALKSLKSVVQNELAVSLATGTPFAGAFGFLPDAPARVLMFQLEIPPFDYQQRLVGVSLGIDEAHRELLRDNFLVYKIADGEMPRLRGGDKGFLSLVLGVAEDAEADVVMFDPLQRMTHGASMDKADEMDPILDAFAELQRLGYAVVYSHHNNKAGRNIADPYAMTGTQRFGADVDTVCSLYRPRAAVQDDNAEGIKERNLAWTLRNGFAPSRSVRVNPNPDTPELMVVTFDEPITDGDTDTDLF